MSARPTYSDEFKADAVELVVSSGRSPASVAPELGISVTALKRWVRLSVKGNRRAAANRMTRRACETQDSLTLVKPFGSGRQAG